jgi:hypothetical protein
LSNFSFDEAPLPYSITMKNNIYCCYFTLHQHLNIMLVNGMSQIQNMFEEVQPLQSIYLGWSCSIVLALYIAH